MKYKCLVFDHDDTVVNSTATIHQPCFQAYLDQRSPGKVCDLETYFLKNFDPGFVPFCREEYHMSDADLLDETHFWQQYVAHHIPKAYEGIREIMLRHKAAGGILAVVSHSFDHYIRRDYAANDLPEPDIVFGWEQPADERKPSVVPLQKIMQRYDLQPSELVMIDDLKPGYDMARAAGVDFVAVGWANDIAPIETFMRRNCRNYCKTVQALSDFLE